MNYTKLKPKAIFFASCLLSIIFLGGNLLKGQCTPPPDPTPVTATPNTITCGASTNLNGTSPGNTISWYTVPSGGVSIGSSASGANFPVSPVVTTTYYAESVAPGGGGPGSQTFSFTGALQTFTVPAGVTSITIDCYGAQSQGGNGGNGGRAQGVLTVTPGQVLNVYVGGQAGYNGGGVGWVQGGGRNGGGGSDVRVGGIAIADRVIVAGGGGASGQHDVANYAGGIGGGGTAVGSNFVGGGGGPGYGGAGANGGNTGGVGNNTCHSGGAGGGGLTSGGGASCNTCYTGSCGQNGSLGLGGNGDTWENGICFTTYGGTSGGGGGYYGGGGTSVGNCGGGSGGGGSSWTGTLTSPLFQAGVRTGNGQVIISWTGTFCVSLNRTPVTVTVNSIPAPTPVTATPSTISCGSSSNLNATSPGNTISWFTVPSGGVSIGTSPSGANFSVSPLVTTTYYAESFIGGCISSSRTPVTVTVNSIAAPTPVTATPTTIACGASSNLNATSPGNTISWFTVPSGGVSIGTSASGANFSVSPLVTTTYYAESFIGACVSPSRTPVTVTVTSIAAPTPVTATPSTIPCGGTSNLNATSPGNTISWFTVPSGGVSIGTSASGANFPVSPIATTTYYAEAFIGVCVSTSRTPVTVTVSLAAPTPVTATPSTITCGSSSNLNGTSPGNTIYWYTVPSGGVSIGNSPSGANFSVSPIATTTYYAEAAVIGGGPGSQTFSYTGALQTFTVPAGVTSVTIDCYGAQSQGGNGGNGGRAQGVLSVTPGQVLNIYVGGQAGYNGGGIGWVQGGGRNGGGGSDVRVGGTALGNRVIVAGGGGASGPHDVANYAGGIGGGGTAVGSNFVGGGGGPGYGGAGAAGGNTGGAGNNTCHSGGAGGGGLTSGGGASCNTCYTGSCGQNGSLGQGGNGDTWENGICFTTYGGTSGGGGGYYGGGGTSVGNCGGGSGGGGSSWTGTLTSPLFQAGVRTGNGQVILTWTGGISCVSGTRTPVTVTVNLPAPPVITPSGPTTFCAGGNVTLSVPAGYASYLWSNGGTGNSIVVTTSGTYNVTVTDLGGCTGNASPVTVTVNPNPTAPVITPSGPTTFCTGGSVTLTSSYVSGNLWSTGATSQSIVVTTSGSYTVTYTDLNGCSAVSPPVVVTVSGGPTPVITPSGPITFCTGGNVNLDAGAGYLTYAWSTGATSQTINVTTSGTYTVTVTIAGGCSGSATPVTVTVNPNPTAPVITPSGPTTFCNGGSVTLTSSYVSGNLWSTGATSQSIVVTTSGSYTVTYTDLNGCSAVSSPTVVTVTAGPSPVITPSGPTTFCAGGNVNLDAGAGYLTYTWSTGATSQTINVTTSGTYTVTVTIAGGCSGTATPVTVTVNPNPTPVITPSGPTTFCNGGSVTLDAGAGYTNYAWSNGANTQTINVTASGTFDVTVTDANGCVGTSSPVTVTVSPGPSPVITPSGPTTFCAGGNVNLDAGSGYLTYAWSNGANTQTINVTTSGTYTVTVTIAGGCSGTATPITVTVNPNPTPVITPSGPTTFCTGGNVTLDAGAGYTNYAWSNGANTQTINVTASGTFIVTVTNANGCVGVSSPITVTVGNFTTPIITPSGPTTFCAGGSVTLDAGAGFTSYLWSPGGQNTQTINVTTSGTYSVSVTDAGGCSGTSSPITVTVNPSPSPTITPSGPTAFCIGGSVTLDAGAGFTSYLWSPGGQNTQTINVTTSGTYSVSVTGNNGCSGTSGATTVTVNPNPVAGFTFLGNGNTVSFLDGSVGSIISWSWTFGDAGTDAVQNPVHTYATLGNYNVCLTVTDANGCTNQFCQSISVTTAILNPLQNGYNVSVNPNPGPGFFNLELLTPKATKFSLKLYSQLGIKVFEQTEKEISGKYHQELFLQNIADGVYNLVVEMPEGNMVYKLVIQK